MKIKCCVSYRVLGAEKTNVYTIGSPPYRARAYETGILDIPEELKPYEPVSGGVAVELDGIPYDLNQLLGADSDGNPVIRISDGYRTRRIPLTYIPDDGDTLRRAD